MLLLRPLFLVKLGHLGQALLGLLRFNLGFPSSFVHSLWLVAVRLRISIVLRVVLVLAALLLRHRSGLVFGLVLTLLRLAAFPGTGRAADQAIVQIVFADFALLEIFFYLGDVGDLVQMRDGPRVQKDLLFDLLLVRLLAVVHRRNLRVLEELVELRLLRRREGVRRVGEGFRTPWRLGKNEVEQLSDRNNRNAHSSEEVVHVDEIPLEKLQRLRMIMLYRLGDVN